MIDEGKANEAAGSMVWVVAFIVLVVLIVAVPVGFYFTNFTGGLSPLSSDWANFGSYLSGTLGSILSTASVIALIITLHKTSRDSRVTQSLTLQALEKSERQIALMEQEFKVHLLMGYVANLNQAFDDLQFIAGDNNVSREGFLDEAYYRLSVAIWARQCNQIGENRRGFDFYLSGQLLNELKMKFPKEERVYWYVLDLIDKNVGELRSVLIRTLLAHVSHDLLFWLSGSTYQSNQELLSRNNHALFFLSDRAADSIHLGMEKAKENTGPPERPQRK